MVAFPFFSPYERCGTEVECIMILLQRVTLETAIMDTKREVAILRAASYSSLTDVYLKNTKRMS